MHTDILGYALSHLLVLVEVLAVDNTEVHIVLELEFEVVDPEYKYIFLPFAFVVGQTSMYQQISRSEANDMRCTDTWAA